MLHRGLRLISAFEPQLARFAGIGGVARQTHHQPEPVVSRHAAVRISWSWRSRRSGAPNASAASSKAMLAAHHGSESLAPSGSASSTTHTDGPRGLPRAGRPYCESSWVLCRWAILPSTHRRPGCHPDHCSDREGCSRGRASASIPGSVHHRHPHFRQSLGPRQIKLGSGLDHGAHLRSVSAEQGCDRNGVQNLHGRSSCVSGIGTQSTRAVLRGDSVDDLDGP